MPSLTLASPLPVIPELVQENCNPIKIAEELLYAFLLISYMPTRLHKFQWIACVRLRH